MKQRQLVFIALYFSFFSIWAEHKDVHITHFGEEDGFEQDIVSYAIQDTAGYVWLGTWNGLCRYDGYRFRNYRMRPGDGSPLRTNRISTVRELLDHNLECTTSDSLTFVFHRQTGRFEQIDCDYGQRPRSYKADAAVEAKVRNLAEFSDTFFRILLVDRQGGIWIDTHSGLYRVWFGNKPLQPVKIGQTAEEEVHGLFIDGQGRTWVADKNGMVRVANRYLSPDGGLSDKPVCFGQKVYCIFEDSQGSVWLGAKPDGLSRLFPKDGGNGYDVKRYVHDASDKYSLNCNNVYDIAEDAHGRLWIATYQGGLNMFDLHSPTEVFVHRDNDLSGWPMDENSCKVRCLYITPQQMLMVGTLNGLYTCSLDMEPGKMTFHHHKRRADDATSLSSDWILDIEPAGGHMVAIATGGGGLCLADDRQLQDSSIRFNTFTIEQGLPSDVCQSLFYRPSDALYVVSQASICRFSVSDLSFTNYVRGMLGDNFKLLDTKPVCDADGQLLFGTTQGVLSVSREDLQKSRYQPPIVFDGPDNVSLSSDERTLTVHFAALDFNRSVPVMYAYRIDGMTDAWNYITDNHITLPDIPAGTFTLHLRSTNGDGVWADNERTIIIHRRAAFHETPFAWMLYGLLFTLFALAIIKVILYIRELENEIKDIRLTSNQRIEVMGERIRELLSISESVEKVKLVEEFDNEEDRVFAERVKAFVLEHMADADLSVQEFAQAMAVSRTLLYARMKSVFNTSPNNFLLNQRIEQAKTMLRQPNVLVADAAYSCGFSDPKYFSKCFKNLVGQTPTDYQKSFSSVSDRP